MARTLLLADDSVTIQKVVKISFANEDLEVVTVDNGDDAIETARSMRPDVILADVVMPGQSGYEVCAAIRNDPDLVEIPVLLLAGTFEDFDPTYAESVGANGHLEKPFEAQTLVDRVHELLSVASPPAGKRSDDLRPAEVGEVFDLEADDFDDPFLPVEESDIPSATSDPAQPTDDATETLFLESELFEDGKEDSELLAELLETGSWDREVVSPGEAESGGESFAPAPTPREGSPDSEARETTRVELSAGQVERLVERVLPSLREEVHQSLERIAWEAFGDLSEQVVTQAVARIEEIAWETVPKLAETLIQEEIRKLGGED